MCCKLFTLPEQSSYYLAHVCTSPLLDNMERKYFLKPLATRNVYYLKSLGLVTGGGAVYVKIKGTPETNRRVCLLSHTQSASQFVIQCERIFPRMPSEAVATATKCKSFSFCQRFLNCDNHCVVPMDYCPFLHNNQRKKTATFYL